MEIRASEAPTKQPVRLKRSGEAPSISTTLLIPSDPTVDTDTVEKDSCESSVDCTALSKIRERFDETGMVLLGGYVDANSKHCFFAAELVTRGRNLLAASRLVRFLNHRE